MATKRRYTPSGTSIGFTSRTGTQQASVSNIEKQTRTIVGGLERSREDKRAQDELYIAGLSKKFDFEEGVQKTKHKLEQQHRKHLREAAQKKADTHVARLQGEADELKKEADYLADLAPKRAKAAGELAKAAYYGIEWLEYQELSKKWEKADREFGLTDKQEKEASKIVESATRDGTELPARDARHLDKITRRLENNIFWQRRMLDYFNTNRKSFAADVDRDIIDGFGQAATEKTAYELYETAGYQKLIELNISSTSKTGRLIMEQYRSWGKLKEGHLINVNDAKDTQDMLVTLAEDFLAAKATGNKDDMNLILNSAAILLSRGTYEVGEGRYQVGLDDGYAGGVTKFLEHLLEKHGDKYRNHKEIWNDFEGLKTVDRDKKGFQGKELWTVKAHSRFDEAIDTWISNADKRKKKSKALQDANRDALEIKVRGLVTQAQTDGNLKEQKRSILNVIYSDPHTTQKEKDKLAEATLGMDMAGYGGYNNYQTAVRALEDGDDDLLVSALNDMDEDERKEFSENPQNKLLFDLAKGVKPGKASGLKQFNLDAKQVITTHGAGASAYGPTNHASSEFAMNKWKAVVLDELSKTDGQGIDIGIRVRDAYAEANKLLNSAVALESDGAGGWRLPKDADPKQKDNPFNYVNQRGGIEGVYQKGVIYVNLYDQDTKNELLVERILAQKDLENKDQTDIDLKLSGIQLKPLNDDTIKFGNKKDVLKHVRFISPDKREEFFQALKKRENEWNEIGEADDLESIMPRELKLWAETHNLSNSQAINQYLRHNAGGFPGIRVSADGTDVAFLDNPNQKVRPKDYDALGLKMFNSARVNGQIPIRPEVRWYTDNEGVSTLDAFSSTKDLNINYTPAGDIDIQQYEKFWEEGGQQHLTDFDWQTLMPVTLQWDNNIGWYKDKNELKRQRKLYHKIKKDRLKTDPNKNIQRKKAKP